jgi:ABC-type transport system substrate-binding protein
MTAHPGPLTFPVLRGLLAVLVVGGLVLGGLVAGQDPPAGAPPSGKTPPKKGARSEDEDEDNPAPKNPKVIRVEEEDPKAKAPQSHPADAPEIDLQLAARQARNAAVRRLFRELAVPHDVVTFRSFSGVARSGQAVGERVENVEPLPEYVGTGLDKVRNLPTLHPFDSEWKPIKPYNATLTSIKSIQPYERVAVEAARDFLNQHYENLAPEDRKYLSRRDQLMAAEQALAAAVTFHESALQKGQRRPEGGWEPVEAELRRYLLDVQLDQLNDLAAAREWDQAFALTRRLAGAYTEPQQQARIAQPLAKLLEKALHDPTMPEEKLREARLRLKQLEEEFPGNRAVAPITSALREQAQALFDEAKRLGKDKKGVPQAQELLKLAEETWPQLPGLRAYRIELSQTHPVLRVGVRELPASLSPALALTDTELRAVELQFESLVRLSPGENGVLRYNPGLAEGRPRIEPLCRVFNLPRGARWSNDRPLTASDVRFTVRLRAKAGADDLLEKAELTPDPYRVKLNLRQGYLDPLALMTFKILPEGVGNEDFLKSEEFARKPVGSGPFMYGGIKSDQEREYRQFVANPNYGSRPSKLGLPHVQEVRFYQSSSPAKDLEQNRIDLAVDLTADDAKSLQGRADVKVQLPGPQTMNRRVYFLAVNLRRPGLANAEFRRMLSVAINREKLLDDVYRGSLGRAVHKAINGPFPAGSWACSPNIKSPNPPSLDPFDHDLAVSLAKQPETRKGMGPTPLTLKYPEGDAALDKAMEALVAQVKEAAGIELQLVKRSPRDLRADVEEVQSFDLAYYHFDFPDETYSLWPLLGPGPGGSGNFFGFQNNQVETNLQELRGHRDFAQVKRYMHGIHEILNSEVPLIPLWQLDPLLAWHPTVKPPGPVDPLLVFTDIDRWRVDPR